MAERDLESIAYPKLDDAQLARLERCANPQLQRHPAGSVLFDVGAREFAFYVVKAGEIEIQDPSVEPPRTVVVHGPGEFTGDVSHLTGRPAVVRAVARTDCTVYQVSPAALRDALNQCPELCDVILQAFIARRQLLRESGAFTGVRVIGSRYSKDTFRLRDFLSRNRVLFTWLDLETDPEVDRILKRFGVSEAETPVVAWGSLLLRNPSNRELAEALGILRPVERAVYDLAVVGAGPSGLAAAVYGASEGLATVVLERTAPGGQAAGSMRIENYLGFPAGITGAELAERAVLQANRFGAVLSVPTPVTGLRFANAYAVLELDGGETLTAKTLLIATGADYRRLPAENCERLEGSGVYYAATFNEAQLCRGAVVVLVGGGNSAGQAAVFLATHAKQVVLVVRENGLYENMSSYLARRIEHTDNIEVLLHSEVKRMRGERCLEAVEVVDNQTGQVRTIETPALFSFIGATPRTDWLPPEIQKDAGGYVCTGPTLARMRAQGEAPPAEGPRARFLLETSQPGVFAAGDVRAGSIKRVASAVGEGAMAVQFVHEHLRHM